MNDPLNSNDLDLLAINTIRTLSMDAVQQARSGHPGTPMALAPVAYTLWSRMLRFDPADPAWPARDRFILSCGHASMLLYGLLHLADVRDVEPDGIASRQPSVDLEAIKHFRQLHSVCAGHPEYGEAAGIETTSGPLGQGLGNSVGMAIAGRWFAARYDRPGLELFDFSTYALCGDGDIMEGVAYEAASLAGHLKLSNLCWIYDDNRITIEGSTDLAFSEDVARRFEGLGWQVVSVADANDLQGLQAAFETFRATVERPTLVVVRSTIGFGSPGKAGSHAAHGAPLGEPEVAATKQVYGWPAEPSFYIPDGVREHFAATLGARGRQARQQWVERWEQYRSQYPAEGAELERIWEGRLPADWEEGIPTFEPDAKGLATRVSSGQVLNQLAGQVPWLIGGSADLAPSTMTLLTQEDAGHFGASQPAGRNFHFGIREHAMAATCNGMALCGLRPFAATFFVFSDYLRPAMRLSAMMRQPVLYVFTHDSIGLGEDGPTHQPVEQLAACRAIPGLLVIRPADAGEVAEAYRTFMQLSDRPAALVLSRQALPTLDRQQFAPAKQLAQGGYVLRDSDGRPEVILIGTGSEVAVCLQAAELLSQDGHRVRVVSMPCWELFDLQPATYRQQVLPEDVTARVAVEAGVGQGWERYVGPRGRFVGMQRFGASAPYQQLYEHFGIHPEAVAAAARELLD